ncbi:signal peptidase i [hydrocarbon metagenome]|uniref:signal peptidase I n=1 Tax=hydrocarbon metagenome TaxID=938273 RepID=A0A0W8E6X0_9ZZZZ
MSKEFRGFIKEFFSIILISFVLAMVLRTWIIEGRIVPTGSMLPTIQLQDRLMVNKMIYRFAEPQRGDIIVFEPPDEIKARDDFVKRLVAIPGDKVEVKNGLLYVNDEVQQEPYVLTPMDYAFGPVVVPPDSYFVMGDNRNCSYDSHLWGAWLIRDHIIGKAFATYWPIDRLQTLKRYIS